MHFVGPDHRKQNFMCPYPSWGPINGQTVAGLYQSGVGGPHTCCHCPKHPLEYIYQTTRFNCENPHKILKFAGHFLATGCGCLERQRNHSAVGKSINLGLSL